MRNVAQLPVARVLQQQQQQQQQQQPASSAASAFYVQREVTCTTRTTLVNVEQPKVDGEKLTVNTHQCEVMDAEVLVTVPVDVNIETGNIKHLKDLLRSLVQFDEFHAAKVPLERQLVLWALGREPTGAFLAAGLHCGDCLVELNDLRLESFSGVNGKQQLLLALDASLQEQRQRCSAQEAAGSV
eukprot:16827-Heterococcus_DN1.PRE.2